MRQLPRPLHAVEYLRSAFLLPCRSTLTFAHNPCIHLRTNTAAFSTTSSRAFLLQGKQDKKKHQQFVRRWQRRLLGDSEPIGAHVDPYDPTSPVRIAPEDQGEYEEILDDDNKKTSTLGVLYDSAKSSQEDDELLHIGGTQWLRERLERDVAREFEKLTRRTYTPLTSSMASGIMNLTSTPLTHKDQKLQRRQRRHIVTGKPCTHYDIGPHGTIVEPEKLRRLFAQAVAEIYALKQVSLDMDLSNLANRGIYDAPTWIQDVTLTRTICGESSLCFPSNKSVEDLVQAMQTAPSGESSLVETVKEEFAMEEVTERLEPILPQEQLPIMDPDTPAFRRAAVVKIDTDRKPFDFMSNRPVPRANPSGNARVKAAVQHLAPSPHQKKLASSSLHDLMRAAETSRSAVGELRYSILDSRAQRFADDIRVLSDATQNLQSSSTTHEAISEVASTFAEETVWRQTPIKDLAVKFALFKRLLQLTGLRISDPLLHSSKTLGELYKNLCTAAKPQPTSLSLAIRIEGTKSRERSKKQSSLEIAPKRRADLSDLVVLGNVNVRSVTATQVKRDMRTGLGKVVEYALWERMLSGRPKPKVDLSRTL